MCPRDVDGHGRRAVAQRVLDEVRDDPLEPPQIRCHDARMRARRRARSGRRSAPSGQRVCRSTWSTLTASRPPSRRASSSSCSTSRRSCPTPSRTIVAGRPSGSNWLAATMPASGVRSSCAASAANWRSRVMRSSSACAISSIARASVRDLVAAVEAHALAELARGDPARGTGRATEPRGQPSRERDADESRRGCRRQAAEHERRTRSVAQLRAPDSQANPRRTSGADRAYAGPDALVCARTADDRRGAPRFHARDERRRRRRRCRTARRAGDVRR